LSSMFSRCSRRLASSASALVKHKRFYKEVSVVTESVAGTPQYKITLDGRVVKTQAGRPLQMGSEPLAMAVAEEWACQQEHIEQGHMRLSGLAMTAIDNPLAMTKESITSLIMEYLSTDTVLFFAPENQILMEAQKTHWAPLIDATNEDMNTQLQPALDFLAEPVSPECRRKFESWLMSYDFWALTGMQYAVQSSKSVIIPHAMIRHKVGVRQAVELALLEQQVQAKRWGEVEWAHTIDNEELCTRLSSGVLFTYLNSNQFITKSV
ncbi:hypothetical protein PENTCL1PPCAC_19141, partial [Pristionchus entomophagus]